MFIQVITGTTTDPDGLRRQADRWEQEVRPGAIGFLGSTGGVTDDGRVIVVARFESEEAARRNSARDEQGTWWAETEKYLDGATFQESVEITTMLGGGSDDAGFIQIMRGRGTDPARARELMAQNAPEWAEFRPDVIGSVSVGHEGGGYTMAMYFASEEAAREGERKEPPPQLKAQMDELNALSAGVPEFFDLKEPWLYSRR